MFIDQYIRWIWSFLSINPQGELQQESETWLLTIHNQFWLIFLINFRLQTVVRKMPVKFKEDLEQLAQVESRNLIKSFQIFRLLSEKLIRCRDLRTNKKKHTIGEIFVVRTKKKRKSSKKFVKIQGSFRAVTSCTCCQKNVWWNSRKL